MTTRALLPLLFAMACTPNPDDRLDPPPVLDTTSPAALELVSSPDLQASSVVPTVFQVRFESTAAASSWVEVTDALGTWSTPILDDATTHVHSLLGLKAGHPVTVRAVLDGADGEQVYSEPQTIAVPPAPPGMPDFQVVTHDPARTTAERFFTLTYLVGGGLRSYAVVVDQDGDPVWWASQVDDSAVAMVKPSLDGEALLVAHFRESDGDLGVYRVPLDAMTAADVTLTPAVDAHHDFVELPDGTITHIGDRYPAIPYGPQDDVVVKLDQIVEVSPDGERRVIFDVLDAMPELVRPSCSHTLVEEQHGVLGAGWGHANSLVYDASDDTYLLNLRNIDMMVKVDRDGEIVWRMGGPASDFDFTEQSAWDHGHFSSWQSTEFGMFSNGLHEGVARAVWYEVDMGTGEVRPTWTYEHPDGIRIHVLGDVDRLPGGNMFVAWGPDSALEEITADGEVVWRVEAVPETTLARVDWFSDLYGLTGGR